MPLSDRAAYSVGLLALPEERPSRHRTVPAVLLRLDTAVEGVAAGKVNSQVFSRIEHVLITWPFCKTLKVDTGSSWCMRRVPARLPIQAAAQTTAKGCCLRYGKARLEATRWGHGVMPMTSARSEYRHSPRARTKAIIWGSRIAPRIPNGIISGRSGDSEHEKPLRGPASALGSYSGLCSSFG